MSPTPLLVHIWVRDAMPWGAHRLHRLCCKHFCNVRGMPTVVRCFPRERLSMFVCLYVCMHVHHGIKMHGVCQHGGGRRGGVSARKGRLGFNQVSFLPTLSFPSFLSARMHMHTARTVLPAAPSERSAGTADAADAAGGPSLLSGAATAGALCVPSACECWNGINVERTSA